MNDQLVDYGIQNENSDIRIHVCILVKKVYIFELKEALKVYEKYPEKPVVRNQVLTAKGRLVPPFDIPGCKSVDIPKYWPVPIPTMRDSPSLKGSLAVNIVKQMARRSLLHIPLRFTEIDDIDMQIKGVDAIIETSLKIQIKCDFRGGEKEFGGTGNLFLQTAERNYHQEH